MLPFYFYFGGSTKGFAGRYYASKGMPRPTQVEELNMLVETDWIYIPLILNIIDLVSDHCQPLLRINWSESVRNNESKC